MSQSIVISPLGLSASYKSLMTHEDVDPGRQSRIEQAYRRAGFKSVNALALKLKRSQPGVRAAVVGEAPGIDIVKEIAEITGVPFEWLEFGGASSAPEWASGEIERPPRFTWNDMVREINLALAAENARLRARLGSTPGDADPLGAGLGPSASDPASVTADTEAHARRATDAEPRPGRRRRPPRAS